MQGNERAQVKTSSYLSQSLLLPRNLPLQITLVLAHMASNWSERVFSLAFSALDLWILSMRTLLFLNMLPLTFRYMSWYMCLSIFLASRYLRRRRLRTRILRIHRILVGSLASLVPLRLPVQRAESQVTTQISTITNTIMPVKAAATNHIQSDGPSAWPHVPSLHETWSGSSEAS